MRRGDGVVVAFAAATIATTFLPWGASGRAERDSYALAADVSQLGILRGATATAATAWPLVAVLAAAAVCAVLVGARRLGAVLCGGLGLAVGAGAAAVLSSPLRPLPGCWAALTAGLACLAAGLAAAGSPSRGMTARPLAYSALRRRMLHHD